MSRTAASRDAVSPARHFGLRGLRLALVGLALGMARPGLAEVVAPSQVTPPNLRQLPEPAPSPPKVPAPPTLQAPAGAAGLDVIIDDVQVEGGFRELAAATAALVGPLRGHRITVARIYNLANTLEQDYARAGFVLARLSVPPQRLLDHGRLRLVVVDGFIEDIDLRGVPGRVRKVVAARLAWLIHRRHITLHEIERAVLVASDVPGVTLRSALEPGTAEGATRLIIEAEQRLVSGSLGFNDRLPSSLGRWQYSGNLALNSPFGFGEQFYTSFGLGADLARAFAGTTPLKIYGGGVVIPLGTDGLTINPEYTHTRSLTLGAPGVIPSAGQFDRYAIRLAGPLIRTRSDTLAAQLSLEHIEQKSSVPSLGVDLSLDRYTVVRLAPDYTTTLFGGTGVEFSVTLSRGLGGRGAAEGAAAGLPLSELGAAPNFNKAAAVFHLTQGLPGALLLDVTGQGQSSLGKAMLASEQLSLTSANAVSAFADGSINVDEGAMLRLEIGHDFPLAVGAFSTDLTPYAFAATGHGHLVRATQLQQPVTNAEAVGLGARGGVADTATGPGANFGLEVARQFTDQVGLRQGWRCNLNLGLIF